MADTARSSGRTAEIGWRVWGEEAFQDAARTDRPIFLNISTFWCHWCHEMERGAFADDAVVSMLNEQFVPIRVDGDRFPHVQDRYIAGGWPTNAFLTPTGEVIWASTYVEAEALIEAGRGIVAAWRQRRAEIQEEVERRRRAMDAARKRHVVAGLVRREAADDVLTATRDGFDARYGGFGTAPKFPAPRAIELLYSRGLAEDPGWAEMADRTLDGMIAGELLDRADGGFFRYAMNEDWTAPRFEKLLDVNAALLQAYAIGAHLRGRRDWRQVAENVVGWADRFLARPDLLWGASQHPDDGYFRSAATERVRLQPPQRDASAYASWNAQWIAALADAGRLLGVEPWVERAAAALRVLLGAHATAGDVLVHCTDRGQAPASLLLADTLYAALACFAVYQATGEPDWLTHARRLTAGMQRAFWAEEGGFWDRTRGADDVGALRYRDRPFEANADVTRLLLDLCQATGDRKYRALAERQLALLSPQAGRYGVDGAAFALAVEEFFDPPPRIVIAGEGAETAALRSAAHALRVPGLRVFATTNGGRIGTLRFASPHPAAAFACGPRGCSPPVTDADGLPDALAAVS